MPNLFPCLLFLSPLLAQRQAIPPTSPAELVVRVADASDRPIAKAWIRARLVHFEDPPPVRALGMRRGISLGVTGSDGRLLADLPALFRSDTTWELSAGGATWLTASSEERAFQRGETFGLVLEPADSRLVRGRIRDATGELLPHARVRFVYDHEGQRVVCTGTSSPTGAFRILSEHPEVSGTLVIEHDEAKAAPLFAPDITVGKEERLLQLSEADPRLLEVVDGVGSPIPHATVTLTWWVEGHGLLAERNPAQAAQRKAILLPDVPFSLNVSARHFKPASFGPFSAADVDAPLRLQLVPLPPIRGSVTWKGQPVDARVWSVRVPDVELPAVELAPPTYGFGLDVRDGVLTASHRFEEAWTYDIFAWNDKLGSGRLRGVRIDPAVGVEGLRIELDTPPGCIEGRVLVPAGRAVDRLLLRGPGGLMAVRPDGTFRLPRCPAGPSRVRVIEGYDGYEASRPKNLKERLEGLLQGEQYIRSSHPPTDGPDWLPFQPSFAVDVPAGGTTRLVIDLRRPLPYRIEGTIRIDGRAPRVKEPMGYGSKLPMVVIDPGKERVDLGPLDQDFLWISRVDLDPDGTFEVGVEAPGTYRLMCRLELEDGTLWNIVDRVDVQAQETVWAKDLRTGRLIAGKRDWEGWRRHRYRWANAGSELRVFASVRGAHPTTVPAGVVQEIVDHEGERTLLFTHSVEAGRTTEASPGDGR